MKFEQFGQTNIRRLSQSHTREIREVKRENVIDTDKVSKKKKSGKGHWSYLL